MARFNVYEFYEYLNRSGAWARLDAGDPDIPPPQPVLEVLRREAGRLGYTGASGLPELRERIAELHGVDAREVIVVPGAKAAIAALVHSSSTLGLVAPYWPGYQVAARLFSKRVVVTNASMREEWRPSLEAVYSLARMAGMVVVNYPNNPTGAILEPRVFRELVEAVAVDAGAVLVSDEAYRDIVFDGSRVVAAEVQVENVVSVYSFSKTFSVPGLRVGYAVGDPGLLGRIRRFIEATYTCVPVPAQLAALKALELLDEAAERARRVYGERVKALEGLVPREVFSFTRPRGAFYAFLRIETGVDGVELAWRAARRGVGVFPGVAFGGEKYKDYVRVSLTSPVHVLAKAVRVLAEEACNAVSGGRGCW